MRNKLLLAFASAFLSLAAAVSLLEIHLRGTRSHVVAWAQRSGVVLDQDAGALVQQTARGSRLIPGAHALIKNHGLSGLDVEMKINSFGFRGPEVAMPKPAAVTRILAVGDSITWGDYLPDEQTYPRQLEKRLREKAVRAEVINAEIGDIGIVEEIDVLSERGLAVEPDVVLVGFYLNDSRPSWGLSRELRYRGWVRRHSMVADQLYQSIFYRRQHLDSSDERFAWIRDGHTLDWQHDHGAFQAFARKARFDWGAAWNPESWDVVFDSFAKLSELAREHHFRVVIAVFPVVFQVLSDFVDDVPQQMVAEIGRRFGFTVLDLLPALRDRKGGDLFFDQCHLRPAGNEVVAEEIARVLTPGKKAAHTSPRK